LPTSGLQRLVGLHHLVPYTLPSVEAMAAADEAATALGTTVRLVAVAVVLQEMVVRAVQLPNSVHMDMALDLPVATAASTAMATRISATVVAALEVWAEPIQEILVVPVVWAFKVPFQEHRLGTPVAAVAAVRQVGP
jgi:hypothetical protein